MSKQTKCPQCGIELFNEYYTAVQCPMCGWGKSENVTLTPPSNLAYKLSTKSPRWKAAVIGGAFIALLILTPLISFGRNQLMANQAVALAKTQMDKRLYASAARTLNQAPRNQTTAQSKKELNDLLSDTVRWAHDISDVGSAKDSMVADNPDDALDDLSNIDEDFPQEDEATDLTDMAQEQELDSDLDYTEEDLDSVAFTPDDPELDNLDEITTDAEEQIANTNEGDNDTAQTTSPTTTAPASNTETDPAETPPASDDPSQDEPTEQEQPDAPDLPNTPAASPANKAPRLVALYQLKWSKAADQDNFYTIDVAGEVTPGKDKKSNFGGYEKNGAIGQIYNRKQAGNKTIVPLYRYWSAGKTNHYYTTNPKFSASNNAAYVKQQVAGYVGKWDGQKCLAGSNPLYSLYNASATNNIYTANPEVKNRLITENGFKNPQVIGCIW